MTLLLHPSKGARKAGRRVTAALLLIFLVLAVIGVAALSFSLHVNLSTAGSVEMLLVLVVALRFGILQATIVSISAFLCLNFLFTDPLYTFTVADPQNWVSLLSFEATALLVSILSSKVRDHAAQMEEQRARAVKLYELSRAILLIDQRQPTSDQLGSLIRDIFKVDVVRVWGEPESGLSRDETRRDQRDGGDGSRNPVEEDSDEPALGYSQRILRLGNITIGAILMQGWEVDPLTADAVGSLAAMTLERTRAIQREGRAEAVRDAERLRTVVLDGLAHGFKTPLTAIQTASSGLLAIDRLNATQKELVSIIDERATMLSQMTTRLLQTAALEARDVRLRRKSASVVKLLRKLLLDQDEETRARIAIRAPEDARDDELDGPLIELALQQLIDNAARYSASGSPIQIAVAQSASHTTVTVQNEAMAGYSIRPEERTKIFERFYRGVDAVYGPAGTGVGLSIAKKTAEAHGGDVTVECSDDTTRFIFSIQHLPKGKQ